MKNYPRDYLTYRYARTLAEAFGTDANTAYAITRYRRRQIILAKWLIRAGFVAWVGLMVIGLLGVV